MNVYLIKTPEYKIDDYNQVLELLRTFIGPMNFLSAIDTSTTASLFSRALNPYKNFHPEKMKLMLEQGNDFSIGWLELFEFCKSFRLKHSIQPEDFVVLLTEQRNTMNWFSMFDGENNAFVDCRDWEHFTEAASKYPIAYEVIANVFRTLMKPEFTLPNPYFHKQTKGCMNDLCMNKTEISLKLRTGDVCPLCINRLNKMQVDDRILDQGINIFEGIRLQVLFREGSRRPRQISEIKLTQNNKLYFTGYGNLELKLFPLQKVLYVFYLNHLNGVRLNELSDHKSELRYWYRKFSNADTNEEINLRVDELINPVGTSFSQKKSSLNNKIKLLLGDQLAQHYKIEGESGEAFKISLPSAVVSLPDDRSTTYA
jgi:hypothetical protein